MAKKNIKSAKNEAHNIPIPRSYDPYAMEQRIYNLEKNAGSPAPTGNNIIIFEKTVTTNNYGWWHATDKNDVVLDPTKYVLLDVTYIRTNESEGEAAYLSCEWMIEANYPYYMVRFVTMRDQSTPQATANTHKVRVTYMAIPEA